MEFKILIPILVLVFSGGVESASFWDKPYEYVMNLGKNIGPNLMSIFECMGEDEAWSCAKDKAGKMLEGFDEDVDAERRSWKAEADAEVVQSGRSLEEMPSKIADDVEQSLASLVDVVGHGMARALRKHSSGSIDSITISAGGEKKKMKKKKPKPAHIHLVHPMMMPMRKAQKEDKGRSFPNGRQSWVIGDTEWEQKTVDGGQIEGGIGQIEGADEGAIEGVVSGNEDGISDRIDEDVDELVVGSEGRGVMNELWSIGNEALDAVAEHAMEAENKDNGIQDKSSIAEQRGKKKKKKKAILKLLILGAVLKAKIGTLLQILSFKLQVKFFIVAILGLAINLARLWIDLKNKHNHQPQKVIYYEHAQHQHHYDHEEEPEHGWGPWSRSMEPEDTDVEIDVDLHNTPYRGQERFPQYSRP